MAARDTIAHPPTGAAPPAPQAGAARDLFYLGLFTFVLSAAVYLATIRWGGPLPRDGTSLPVGRDFLNTWMYGRAAFGEAVARFYDLAAYHDALTALFGNGDWVQNWSYPPSFLLAAAPFGLLPYLPALALWSLAGIAVLAAVALPRFTDRKLALAFLVAPAAMLTLVSGQIEFFGAAVVILVFALIDRRPIVAGVLIGLLTLKPQIGLLFPVMLIAGGHWRAFVTATATTLALAAVSAALSGIDAWLAYLGTGLATQNLVLSDPQLAAAPFMPTVFMNLRLAGVPYGAAMAAQGVVALAAIAAVAWTFAARRDAPAELRMALFTAASAAASPYLLSYSTLPLAFAALVLADRGLADRSGMRLVQLVYFLPLLQVLSGTLHIPGPALIAPAFAVWAIVFIARDRPAALTAAV